MRERLTTPAVGVATAGITPACAGKTKVPQAFLPLPEDHPRVCGKDVANGDLNVTTQGSPPRVRERPIHDVVFFGACRITPACAGKTSINKSICSFIKDHPRVCGKDFNISNFSNVIQGSPPRVRERLVLLTDCFGIAGITPACAGKTGAGVNASLF